MSRYLTSDGVQDTLRVNALSAHAQKFLSFKKMVALSSGNYNTAVSDLTEKSH